MGSASFENGIQIPCQGRDPTRILVVIGLVVLFEGLYSSLGYFFLSVLCVVGLNFPFSRRQHPCISTYLEDQRTLMGVPVGFKWRGMAP